MTKYTSIRRKFGRQICEAHCGSEEAPKWPPALEPVGNNVQGFGLKDGSSHGHIFAVTG
jgi:hypothetical protein